MKASITYCKDATLFNVLTVSVIDLHKEDVQGTLLAKSNERPHGLLSLKITIITFRRSADALIQSAPLA